MHVVLTISQLLEYWEENGNVEKDKIEDEEVFEGEYMKVWRFFLPTIHKTIAFFLISLLWVVPTWKEATCKICWEQGHGFPINFIILDSMSGLYPAYWIDSFSVQTFLIDVIVLYLLSCVITFTSYYLYKEKKITS